MLVPWFLTASVTYTLEPNLLALIAVGTQSMTLTEALALLLVELAS